MSEVIMVLFFLFIWWVCDLCFRSNWTISNKHPFNCGSDWKWVIQASYCDSWSKKLFHSDGLRVHWYDRDLSFWIVFESWLVFESSWFVPIRINLCEKEWFHESGCMWRLCVEVWEWRWNKNEMWCGRSEEMIDLKQLVNRSSVILWMFHWDTELKWLILIRMWD